MKKPGEPGFSPSLGELERISRSIINYVTWHFSISRSKLRGCDVLAVKVDDVAPNGYAVEFKRRKTGRPVRFELTERARQAIDDYIRSAAKPGFCSAASSPQLLLWLLRARAQLRLSPVFSQVARLAAFFNFALSS